MSKNTDMDIAEEQAKQANGWNGTRPDQMPSRSSPDIPRAASNMPPARWRGAAFVKTAHTRGGRTVKVGAPFPTDGMHEHEIRGAWMANLIEFECERQPKD